MIREPHLLKVANEYLHQGWMCIPIPYREKAPGFSGWEDWRLDTPEKLAQHFNGETKNIGVLLGPPSNDIVDVDLDFAECLPFARIFLPDTRQFGRRTNPVSHWLYTVRDAPNRTVFVSERVSEDGKKRETVLEIRGNRHQSVFPASTHKDTGEPILWVGQQPIYEIAFADLYKQCGGVAAGAVLARYWPRTKGNRHECAVALAGLLLRTGFTIEEAECFIAAIAKIAGNDGEIQTNTVKATKTAMDAGKKVTGWKRLSELLNAGLAIVKVPEWLGYTGQTTEASTEETDENSEEEKPKPKAAASLKNAVRAVLNDAELSKSIYYDDFLRRPMTGDPPREWTDADDLELTIKLQSIRGFAKIGVETVRNAAVTVAFRNRRNCVRNWLEGLKWDHQARIDHFFEDHFGAAETKYTRAASRNFWISIVARAYQPGCQVDNMIVLEGAQGIRKSSALRVIGGEYFAEQTEPPTGKDFFQVLQGKLLVEISEMDSFNRAEVTRVKQVITCTSDRFRESYGRHAKDHPRQCVFVGTTNKDDWNRDETGARRFWPIACHGEIDLDAIRANRDQLFAEAVHRFEAGESWWEMPVEETRIQQANRYIPPAWVEPIQRYIENEPIVDDGETRWVQRPEPLKRMSIAEILEYALDLPEGQWTKANEMRVAESLRYLQWKKKRLTVDGDRSRWWIPRTTEDNPDEEAGPA